MEDHPIHIFFFISFIFTPIRLYRCSAAAPDTISADQSIKDGRRTIVSRGQMFELGFFSPGKSKNRYVGIWYKNISILTPVWVANRETPITNKTGMFSVSSDGNLKIISGGIGNSNTTVWSSNATVSGQSNNPKVAVQLLDTGNLVVWERGNYSTGENLIWQSFDHPGDTLLPGMKLGVDLETGVNRYRNSWKGPDDPAIGAYGNILDTNGYPQIFNWRDNVLISRLGPWNGLTFSGTRSDEVNPVYSPAFFITEKEVYHKYEVKSSVIQRIVLTWDGKTRIMHWIERIQEWIVYGEAEGDFCGRFAFCGPYGSCSIDKHPPCSCLQGFEPRNPKEWDKSDWSSGCKQKTPLNCGDVNGEGFLKITGIKVPDTRRSWYNVSMSLGECEMACRRDCSCSAYGNLDIRNGGSGCLLWFGELMDIRECDSDQDIHIRMATSELEGLQADSNKWKRVVTKIPLITLVALLVCS